MFTEVRGPCEFFAANRTQRLPYRSVSIVNLINMSVQILFVGELTPTGTTIWFLSEMHSFNMTFPAPRLSVEFVTIFAQISTLRFRFPLLPLTIIPWRWGELAFSLLGLIFLIAFISQYIHSSKYQICHSHSTFLSVESFSSTLQVIPKEKKKKPYYYYY